MGIAVPIRQEVLIFIWSLAGGGAVGALYDLFRLLRLTHRFSAVSVFLQDLLYWVGAAFLLFLVSLSASGGELRFYELMAAAMGLVLYLLLLSRPLRKLVILLAKILLFPVRLVLRILRKPCFLVISVGKRTGYLLGRQLHEWKKFRKKQ